MDYLGSDPTGSALYVTARLDCTTSSEEMEAKAKVISGKDARILGRLYPGWKIAAGTSERVPAQAILAKANAWKPGLIVLGSHGWSGFGELLLGSIADQVFRHAHANVRVARKGIRNTLNLKTSKADLMPWLERVLDKAALRLGKRGIIVTPMLRVADPRKALLDEAKRMSWSA